MKILVIVTESESANGICAKAVMNELSKHNQVYCITNREHGFPRQFEEDGVRYYTVKPRIVYRLSSLIKHKKLTDNKKLFLGFLNLTLNKIKLLLSVGTWPLISPSYTNRIYKLARKICCEKNIDSVIPVYTQIDTLIAANKIKKKCSSIKYVPYFLDSLSGGYGPKIFSQSWTVKRGLKWERKLLVKSDLIIMMESSRAHHEVYSKDESYYTKIRYLDLPLIRKHEEINIDKNPSSELCTLLYVGTLPKGIRSPEFILNVFGRIQNKNWRFVFVGDDNCDILNQHAAKDDRIIVIGRCDYKQAMEYEASTDVLVNIGNTNANMTPSKIFEYMSWGKKIVSTAPIDNEPSIQYLKKYPLSLILNEKHELDRAAEQLMSFVNNSFKNNVSFDTVKKVYIKNTPEFFVDTINDAFKAKEVSES